MEKTVKIRLVQWALNSDMVGLCLNAEKDIYPNTWCEITNCNKRELCRKFIIKYFGKEALHGNE